MLNGADFRDVYNMSLYDPIFGPFGALSKSKFWTLVTFTKRFHWFPISIASHALQVLSVVCGIWASEAQFGGYHGPKNKSKFRFLIIFSQSFHQYCFTWSWQVLLDVWRIWAKYVLFWATLGSQISQISGLWSFSIKKNSTGFASVLVYMSIELLLEVCWILASDSQFPGHFGPQSRTCFMSLVIFSNIFHWFHILLVLHDYWGYV